MSAEPVGIRLHPDVFVSYRRTDKEFVERLVTALEDQGPEVWWDADIHAGDDWRASIVENLTNSDCLVIVFSRDCNDSTQLVKELGVADHLKKVVIPVKIDDSEPRGSLLYELAWRNWIDVHPDPTSKLDVVAARIVESLKEAGWTPPTRKSATSGTPLPAPTFVAAPSESAAPDIALAPPAPFSPAEPIASSPSADRLRQPAAGPVPPSPGFRLREAFPFHWADFVAPVLIAVLMALGGLVESEDPFGATLGLSLMMAVVVLAITGMIAFPIRYYRRRANPYGVARNLVISNVTFAVAGAVGGALAAAAPSFRDENETTREVAEAFIWFFLFVGVLCAVLSFVIFFALSKARATRELRAHTQTV